MTEHGTSSTARRRRVSALALAGLLAGLGALALAVGGRAGNAQSAAEAPANILPIKAMRVEHVDHYAVEESYAGRIVSRRTIKLGFTASETGEFRQLSEEFVSGIRMWADDLLDRGADPISIVTYDDESSPARAAELYERLITEDQVDLLI